MFNELTRNTLELAELLNERKLLLKNIQSYLEKEIDGLPQGKLHVSKRGKYTAYYRRTNNKEKSGIYIPKKDMKTACDLAQREYDEKMLESIKYQDGLLSEVMIKDLEDINKKFSEEKIKLLKPYSVSIEEFIDNWESEEYETRSFENINTEFYTAKGERVRSKSECLIADTLNRFNIPYRYEYPQKVKGLGDYHPDFTCLNVRKRREVIWEHFGLIDNEGYADNTAYKIKCLSLEGYRFGEDYIFSMETESNPLSTRVVEKMIEQYLT